MNADRVIDADYMPYWGKARPDDGACSPYHPLAFHCLDVAACAAVVLRHHDVLRRRLDELAGVEISGLIPLIAALHDLGKFCTDFQRKAPDILSLLQPETARIARAPAAKSPHWDWGLALWLDMTEKIQGRPVRRLNKLLGASFGHHGAPPSARDYKAVLDRHAISGDEAAATSFVRAMAALLAPGWRLDDPRLGAIAEDRCNRLSFLVAALVNVADWLGSDQERFPYTPPDAFDPSAYWHERALPCAENAVESSGVVPRPPAGRTRFADIFPTIASPRPLQKLADTMALPEGQALILIEDQTGSGKTEAADLLAARLMAGGRGSGLYLAMPTMVTADAMALRHADMYRRLFDDAGSPPGLSLVHGGMDAGMKAKLDEGGAECREWLEGDRRLQLSAEVAVGTIDQALLATMPSRFAAIRLFGLATKVLVVDEVHCHDDYTGTLLDGLLRMHAALGGSAVLLSATLSAGRKERLAKSFVEGAGWDVPADLASLSTETYPCLTILDASGIRIETAPFMAPATGSRTLPIMLEPSREVVTTKLLDRAAAGSCTAWLRGTVDDAIDAYRDLKAGHADVTLLHARFPRSRRRELEDLVVRRFGRESDPASRAGGIVVATQILEQSLDLDFDHMAVDLKPVDALIQSAGRLRRHLRDALGRLIGTGPDGREPSPLLLHAPDPETDVDEQWYRRKFPRAAAIYRRLDWLWLTAALLRREDRIVQPDGLRGLVEGVFGPEPALAVPPALIAASLYPEGVAFADRAVAKSGTLDPNQGYSLDQCAWADDVRVPTRLGDAFELCLVRVVDGTAQPWKTMEGWPSGDLRLRASLIADAMPMLDAHPVAARLRENPSTQRLFRYRTPIPLTADPDDPSVWRLEAAGGGKPLSLAYDDGLGLTVERV